MFRGIASLRRAILAGLVAGLAVAVPAAAQQPVDVRRAQASRAELEAALAQLEQVIASPGYSGAFRKAREAEAAMVRARLAEGDLQVGDQIDITVIGEQTLTNKFTVLPGRILSLPMLPPISLQGVLRSEIQSHLMAEIGKYVKDPQVVVQGSFVRVAILGAVGNPGYYTLPADALVSDAIMQAGGPAPNIDMEKSEVRRSGQEVMAGTELQRAIEAGLSLDQINLHGGDELFIGGGSRGLAAGGGRGGGGWRNWFWPLQAAVSLGFLLTRIF